MTDPADRVQRLRRLAGTMLGRSVRGVTPHPEHGLDLFLVWPPGTPPVRPELQGELRLRVLTHAWRLDGAERVLAAGLDPRAGLGTVLEVLVGRAVTGLEIARPALDTTIGFGDLRLRLFPVSTRPLPEGRPAWTLRTVEGVSVLVGPGTDGWGMTGRKAKEQESAR